MTSFKGLSVGTKIVLICGLFLIPIIFTTYNLIVEKRNAINLIEKEIHGSGYLTSLRELTAEIFRIDTLSLPPKNEFDQEVISGHRSIVALKKLYQTIGTNFSSRADLDAVLSAINDQLAAKRSGRGDGPELANTLQKIRQLASRIGDGSNLTLDSSIDSYYMQDLTVDKIPAMLVSLANMRRLSKDAVERGPVLTDRSSQALKLSGIYNANQAAIQSETFGAYNGNDDGELKLAFNAAAERMMSSLDSFEALASDSILARADQTIDVSAIDHGYQTAVSDTLEAWKTANDQLHRLLEERADVMKIELWGSLAGNILLSAVSAALAFLTARSIITRIRDLARSANLVRATGNYSQRVLPQAPDEIGQLAVAFNEMLTEIESSRQRAQELLQAGDRTYRQSSGFLGNMHHELRLPMQAVSRFAGTLLRDGTQVSERQRRLLQQIVQNGEDYLRLLGDALTLSRAEPLHRSTTIEAVDAGELIQEIAAILEPIAIQRGLDFTTILPAQRNTVIQTDRTSLFLILLNFCSDAIKRSRSGATITLTLETAPGADQWRLSVSDANPGISEQLRKEILQSAAHQDRSNIASGAGALELGISPILIEQVQGRVSFLGEQGAGSILSIDIPRGNA